jgi:phenylacetate-coenzyme A ligase PaaK-like adenylate-forming protein
LVAGAAVSEELTAAVTRAIKSQLGVAAEVNLLLPCSLPTTSGKTKRVIKEP